MRFYRKILTVAVMMLSALFCLLTTGCAGFSRNRNMVVTPFNAAYQTDLRPKRLILVARRAGLDNDQILQYGPAIRNALATHGACRIYSDDKVKIIMAVQGRNLYVSRHTGSSFIYDLDSEEPRWDEESPDEEKEEELRTNTLDIRLRFKE